MMNMDKEKLTQVQQQIKNLSFLQQQMQMNMIGMEDSLGFEVDLQQKYNNNSHNYGKLML